MTSVPIEVKDEAGRKRAIGLIASLDLTKPYTVVIEQQKKKRTLAQNNLMWAWLDKVVQCIHEDTGNDKEDIHEFFKLKFLPSRTVEVFGETERVAGSTTKLSPQEMADYMNKIYAWATTELGLILPVPEARAA
jgi:hypothetical protein